jgi:DNA-binding helix-hairpin-helix protein with protein kinase domain
MQANPPADPTLALGHASIAWPLQLLYDDRGRLIGYSMGYVQNAVPLLQVFNPKLRAKTLPSFNRRYLHRTARNLSAALGALHATNYVVGDLNESNVMVTPSALVTLIDADSFQVQRREGAKPIVHPCPVGKPEYTPPELQGKTFTEVPRQPEHDRFGLAVLVFQLLMEGNHPFRALWLAAGDPPEIAARIRGGHWPHVRSAGLPLAPPRNAPALESLHPDLVALFQQCFIAGHARPAERPTPEAWERALSAAEKALITCRNGHLYSRHLPRCPQCEALAASSPGTGAQPAPAARRAPNGGSPTAVRWRPVVARVVATLVRDLFGPSPLASAPAVQVICRACQHSNPGIEIYCQNCATRLMGRRACPHCNRAIPANAKFCPRCGLRVI